MTKMSHLNFHAKNVSNSIPHTVRKFQIVSKNSFFRKIQNCEIEFLSLKKENFKMQGLPGSFEFSRQKS